MQYFKKIYMNTNIYFTINGKECQASVISIPHRKHSMFKVFFDSGYENIFFTDVETGKWIEEDLGFTALAEVIGKQIYNFLKSPVHVPKLLTWHKQVTDHNVLNFGFFNFMKDKYRMFEIYNQNKKYLYTLVEMDNEEWHILGNNALALKHIDSSFVEQVIQVLPLYWADAR